MASEKIDIQFQIDTEKSKNDLDKAIKVLQNYVSGKSIKIDIDTKAVDKLRKELAKDLKIDLNTQELDASLRKAKQSAKTTANDIKKQLTIDDPLDVDTDDPEKKIKNLVRELKEYQSVYRKLQAEELSLGNMRDKNTAKGLKNDNLDYAIAKVKDLKKSIQDVMTYYGALLKDLNDVPLTAKDVDISERFNTIYDDLKRKTNSDADVFDEHINKLKNNIDDLVKGNKFDIGVPQTRLQSYTQSFNKLNGLSDKATKSIDKLKSTMNSMPHDLTDYDEILPGMDKALSETERLKTLLYETGQYYKLLAKSQLSPLSLKDTTQLEKYAQSYKALLNINGEKSSLNDITVNTNNLFKKNTEYINKAKAALKDYNKQVKDKTEAEIIKPEAIKPQKIDAQLDINELNKYKNLLMQIDNQIDKVTTSKLKLPTDNAFQVEIEKTLQGLNKLKYELQDYYKYQNLVNKTPLTKDDFDTINALKKTEVEKIQSGEILDFKLDDDLTAVLSQSKQNLKEISHSFDVGYKSAKNLNTELIKMNNLSMRASSYVGKYGTNLKKYGQYNDYINLIDRLDSGKFANFGEALDVFRRLQIESRKAGVEVDTFASKFERTFGSRIRSAMAGMGTFYITDSMRAIFNNVKTLDSAMTELKKVTDETAATYNQFMETAAVRSKDIGAKLSETINATADYARLGYGIEDATKLADSALVYFNVGDGLESIDDASSSLISTMQGFGLAASDSMDIVDKFNEVSNNFATSSGDIGEGIKRSAAAMAAAGNSLEQTIGLFTGAQTVVQDADVVGTALKTMSMRLRSSKTDMEAAGVDTEGMATSVSKLRSEIQSLTGVDIMADSNTFKSSYDMLKDLSEVWHDLSDVSQANVLELLFGKRQGNIGAAILEDFSVVERAYQTALNAEGSAQKENEKFKKSIQGRLKMAQSELESFSWNLLDDDLVKGAITSVDLLISSFNKLTDAVGLTGLALGTTFAIINRTDPTKGIFSVIDSVDATGNKKNKLLFNFDRKAVNVDGFKAATSEVDGFLNKLKALQTQIKSGDLSLFQTKYGAESIRNARSYDKEIKAIEQSKKDAAKLIELEKSLFALDKASDINADDYRIKRDSIVSEIGRMQSSVPIEMVQAIESSKDTFNKSTATIDEWAANATKSVDTITNDMVNAARSKVGAYSQLLKEEASALVAAQRRIFLDQKELQSVSATPERKSELKTRIAQQEEILKVQRDSYMQSSVAILDNYIDNYSKGQSTIAEATKKANAEIEKQASITADMSRKNGKNGGMLSFLGGFKDLAGNVVAGLAIGAAIQAGFAIFDKLDQQFNLTSGAKIEDMEKAVDDYNKAISKSTENISTIKSLKTEFTSLSSGVDELGRNVGLTTDEYDRYKEIVAQLVEMNPDIVKGYNAQGQVIIDNAEAISKATKLQEESAKKATQSYLKEGSVIYEGIHAKNTQASQDVKSQLDSAEFALRNLTSNTVKAKESFEKIYGESWDTLSVQDFVDNGDAIANALSQVEGIDSSGIKEFKSTIDSLSESYDTLSNETQDYTQWLKTYAYSSIDAGINSGLGFAETIPKELQASFDHFIEGIANTPELSFDGAKKEIQEFGNELVKLGENDSYVKALGELEYAKRKLDVSDWGADDIDAYDKSIASSTQSLRDFAEQQFANQKISAEARDSILDLADSYQYLTDTLSIEAALKIDDVGLESARTQLEQFQAVAEQGNYTDAIKDLGTIYDTIIDKVEEGQEATLHSKGFGDNTFWDGAERILGSEKLKEINYNVDEAKRLMKEYKKAFEGGAAASNVLFDELEENAQGINKILGYQAIQTTKDGGLNIGYIDPSDYELVADYLGMSRDMFVSLIDNARQFNKINFTNVKQLAAAIQNSEDVVLRGKENAKGANKTYMSYSDFSEKAIAEGYSPKEIYDLSKQLEKQHNIIMVDPDQIDTVESFIKAFQNKNNLTLYVEDKTTGKKTVKDTEGYIEALNQVMTPQEISNLWKKGIASGDYKFEIPEKTVKEYDLDGDKKLSGLEIDNYVQQIVAGLREGDQGEIEEPESAVDAIQEQTTVLGNKLDQLVIAEGGNPEHGMSSTIASTNKSIDVLQNDKNSDKEKVEAAQIVDTNLKKLESRYNQMIASYKAMGISEEEALSNKANEVSQLKAAIDEIKKDKFYIDMKATINGGAPNVFIDNLDKIYGPGAGQAVIDIYTEYHENGDSAEYQAMLENLPEEVQTIVRAIVEGEQEVVNLNGDLYTIDGQTATCIFSADTSLIGQAFTYTTNTAGEITGLTPILTIGSDTIGATTAYNSALSAANQINALNPIVNVGFNVPTTIPLPTLSIFDPDPAGLGKNKPGKPSSAYGTPGRISPSYAAGTKNFGAKGGMSLVGELGEELIWSGDKSYLVGSQGPEMIYLKPGDVVYTAEETKRILAGRQNHPTFGSHFGGTMERQEEEEKTTTTTTTTTTNKKKTTTKSSSSKSSSSSSDKNKFVEAYEKDKALLDHQLEMNYISERTYYTRLNKLYKKHLVNQKGTLEARRQSLEDQRSAWIAAYEEEKALLDHRLTMNYISEETYYKKLTALYQKYYKGKKKYEDEARQALEEQRDAWNNAYESQKKYLDYQYQNGLISESEYLEKFKALRQKYYVKTPGFTDERHDTWLDQIDMSENAFNEEMADLDYQLEHNLISLQDYYNKAKKLRIKYLNYYALDDEKREAKDEVYDKIFGEIEDAYNDLQQKISDKDLWNAWAPGESSVTMLQEFLDEVNNYYSQGLITAEQYAEIYMEIMREIKNAQDDLYSSQKQDVEDMIDLVERLVRQEAQDRIDALNKQKESYNEILDQKRESLELTRQELSFQEDMGDLATQIANKQAEIEMLSRDDSRAGQAKLKEAQDELNDLLKQQQTAIRDETYDQINNKYDDQAELFSELIDKQIEKIEDFLDDQSAVLEEVFKQIDNKETNDLLNRLLEYNRQFGDGFDDTVESFWNDLDSVLEENQGNIEEIIKYLREMAARENDSSSIGTVPEVPQLPKRHSGLAGGYVGANVTPKMNETYALLTKDELVLNMQDQQKLAQQLSNGILMYNSIDKMLSGLSGSIDVPRNMNNQSFDIKIENNIEINSNGNLDTDIERIGEQLSNKTLSKLQNALQLKGIKPSAKINTYKS